MTQDRVRQENIEANGDVAGGNIDKSQTTIFTHRKTQLEGLIDQLREEILHDREVSDFVERLANWMAPKKTELKRDLAEKLTACQKQHLIAEALDYKERFCKQLAKTKFNPALQEIYACILGEIYGNFNSRIKPRISSLTEPGAVEAAIADLASSITAQLSNAPAALGVGITEVIGMLYYLTGNCHIDWDYNAPIPPCD